MQQTIEDGLAHQRHQAHTSTFSANGSSSPTCIGKHVWEVSVLIAQCGMIDERVPPHYTKAGWSSWACTNPLRGKIRGSTWVDIIWPS